MAVFAIVVATPFIDAFNSLLPVIGDQRDFFGGLVAFLAVVGAIIALLTRVPGETRLERAGEATPERIWIIGPFVAAVAFAEVLVLDRGPGIDPAEGPTIRHGLPLALDRGPREGFRHRPVRRALAGRGMGGRVWASPREGGGSEFGFALRAVAADAPTEDVVTLG